MADYLYSSARVRALENRLVGRERMALLPDEEGTAGVWNRLAEYGIEPLRDADGAILREESLLSLLERVYGDVREMLPDDRAVLLWLYPYDCNNVKAAIKAAARGIDPRSMMFSFGTVETEAIIDMVKTGVYEGLPTHMAEAAVQAVSAYAKTANPQAVDLCLDRACYADMLQAAANEPFCLGLVKRKIDLINLLSLIRVLRMRSGEAGEALLIDAWIEGGALSVDFLREQYSFGEESLWAALRSTEYARFAHGLDETATLGEIERRSDDFLMERLREVKYAAYGAEVVTAYLLAAEYEVRNLRIILAGKETGLSPNTIRERIRDGYV
jgi:V/A-type H+-transporting ATPase subunit C